MSHATRIPAILVLAALTAACTPAVRNDDAPSRDPHSFSRPDEAVVRHLELDLTVDFEKRQIRGRATLHVENPAGARELWLDVRDLRVEQVLLGADERETPFRIGEEAEFLGRPLVVDIDPSTTLVHVDYATSPAAIALQWLEPRQTAGGRAPFLLTQSQSVFARTWVPCQDSPGVRITYEATVRVPPGLLALMSAENPTAPAPDGVHRFRMEQPIPSYLLALAVGDLEFRSLGPRTGVYAEPPVLERAAWEFADTESMLEVVEKLYGPYRWGRYDLIVLPPSFPFGGMENPRLSFLTPTLIAGDRSLVGTIAHELAHSWSGNLVTNATWDDFWLNEGFTVYLEKRVMEELYGREYAEMITQLDGHGLQAAMSELGWQNPDTRLHLDLDGRDPELAGGDVAYEKGYLFLRMLEEAFGRERWDAFLRGYFDTFAFRPMTSERFLAHLREQLVSGAADPQELEQRLQIDDWVYGTGLPSNRPDVISSGLDRVDRQLEKWLAGTTASELDTSGWTTHHRIHFIRHLPGTLPHERLAELDESLGLTATGNAMVLQSWLLQAIIQGYEPTMPALDTFLTGIGRLFLLRPLYETLIETPEGRERARRIYTRARPGYHAITVATLDELLGWPWDG